MGFFDSFKTGFAGGSGGGFGVQLGGAVGSIAGSVLGGIGQRAAGALGDLIFGKPKSSGGPFPAPGTIDQRLLADLIRPIPFPPGFQFPAGTVPPTLQEQLFRMQRGAAPIDRRQFQQPPALAARSLVPATSPRGGFTPLDLGGQQVAFPTSRGVGFGQGFQQAFSPGPGPFQTAQFTPALFDIPGFDLQLPFTGQGMGGGFGSVTGGTPMFRAGMAGARAQFFRTQNPVSGQDTWFRPAGRPILWSGDLGACKRVSKVARRARRARPR